MPSSEASSNNSSLIWLLLGDVPDAYLGLFAKWCMSRAITFSEVLDALSVAALTKDFLLSLWLTNECSRTCTRAKEIESYSGRFSSQSYISRSVSQKSKPSGKGASGLYNSASEKLLLVMSCLIALSLKIRGCPSEQSTYCRSSKYG